MEKVKKSNPYLKDRAPFVFFMSWGYALTNILIGLGLYHTPKLPYSFTKGYFGPHLWGIIFLLMGISGALFLVLNRWHAIRRVLMFGLAIKTLFFYGLILTATWQSLSIIGIWTLIAYAQFLTVVYFPQERDNGFN